MSVKITEVESTNEQPAFIVTEVETGEPVTSKNWFEKSKNKWHIVLGPNSSNRKYIAHNEFFSKAVDGEMIVEDKTTSPRTLGTSQPDKRLIPFMTEEDKIDYDAIIARAIANKEAQKKKPLTEEEKLMKQLEAVKAKLKEKYNVDVEVN